MEPAVLREIPLVPTEDKLAWNDGRWGLLVPSDTQLAQDLVLSGDGLFLGRDPSNSVCIPDSRVSGRHCRLFRTDRTPFICDLSTNGTYLNGLRLARDCPVPLSHQDEISLIYPHTTDSSSSDKAMSFVFKDLTIRKRKSSLLEPQDDRLQELKKTLSISDYLRSELGSDVVNRLSGTERQMQFWEVDEAALVQCLGNGVISISEGDCYRLIALKPPHVADTSMAAMEFKKAELAFRRFVNRDRIFTVTQVDIIISPLVEEHFRQTARSMQERQSQPSTQSDEAFTPQQQRALSVLQESVFFCVEGQSAATSPVLAWHGTPDSKLPDICREGLQNLSRTDTGWYGKGVYLTQLPNYGEFYISQKTQDYGESVQLLLCWALMGKAYPITEKREGAACQPGYDSHFALTEGFEPCPLDKEPTGDEIVTFNAGQVLPRYIVRYEIQKRPHVPPAPSPLPPSVISDSTPKDLAPLGKIN